MQNFAECECKVKIPKSVNDETERIDEESVEEKSYSEVGEEVAPEDINETYLESEPTKGQKMNRADTTCRYYKIIKM